MKYTKLFKRWFDVASTKRQHWNNVEMFTGIMLETWSLVRKFTHICSFRKYTFQYQGPLILLMSASFLQKNYIFWQKWYLYSTQYCESCVRDYLVLFSVFVIQKVTVNENIGLTDYASGIRLPDCSESEKTMTSQFANMTSSPNFFDVVIFFLPSLVTDPNFMSISSLVHESWQIRKFEVQPSEFC